MDTESDYKYWPYDDIPIISERVLAKLGGHHEYETAWDTFGERSLKLRILDERIELPKYLTSKGALAFLGFTRTHVKELWQYLIHVPEPMDGPDIECGGEHFFWTDIIQFLDDKISSAREAASNHDRKSAKVLLDHMGLTQKVQMQELRITSDDGQTIVTCLQAQMPKYAFSLAKQYIQQRWIMLLELEDIIDRGGNYRENIAARFTQHPIEMTAVKLPESNPSYLDSQGRPSPEEGLSNQTF